jgi:hypothetical protein
MKNKFDEIIDTTERVAEFVMLINLIPAIEQIDSGCCVCIREFVDDANKQLTKAKSKFRYEYDDGNVSVIVK